MVEEYVTGDYGQSKFDPAIRSEIEQTIAKLCDLLENHHELNNGSTALYWNLIFICAQHIGKKNND